MIWLDLASGVIAMVALAWAIKVRREAQRDLAYLQRRTIQPAEQKDPFSPLFRLLAQALDSGVIVVDHNRVIRFCNPTAAKLFGVSVDEALNHGIITLIRDYHADTMIDHALRRNEPQQMDLKPVLSNKTMRIWCEPSINQGALLIVRDMTQLSQLERARRDLVANVSHELRTPLASISLLIETLQTNPPPELGQRMLGQVTHELEAVMQLVDELHELSQIESGRMILQLQPQPVSEIIERALQRIEPQISKKALHLQTHIAADLPPVYVDTARMGQVLLNLLYNAVKWTDSGGTITLSADRHTRAALASQLITRSDPAPEWVTIAVSDTGAGIPAEALGRIFERFYKVDRARTRGKGGTGLGLAIVKHLVEGHGGVVWATSVAGQGSTFTIALPVVD